MFPWTLQNLVFLDEVSFDNRDMLQKKGYGMKGKHLVFHSKFRRKPRESLLCFIGINGLLEVFRTEGTFDCHKFIQCCKTFATENPNVRQYPGVHSVWILDGAKIHCHPDIVYFLRSIGIMPIFLPAYCPFFNPIEIMFGMVKVALQRTYTETSKKPLIVFLTQVLEQFRGCCF